MKILLITLLSVSSIVGYSQHVIDYKDWEKVEIYDEDEIEQIKNMNKVGRVSIGLTTHYRSRKELFEKSKPLIQKRAAIIGCDAVRLVYDENVHGGTSLDLITGGYYRFIFNVYRKKDRPALDTNAIKNIITNTPKFSIVNKIYLNYNDFVFEKITATGKIKKYEINSDGTMKVYADIPQEYTQWYEVVNLKNDEITISRPNGELNQAILILKPSNK